MQNVISYSLWGNDPKYVEGAKKNIELAKKYFPDWIVKLHLSENTKFEYTSDNLIIIPKKEVQSHDGMFWRFEPLNSDDTVIIRDLDDRLSLRHKFVVDEWLASNKDIHIIRDHPNHTAHILGGLWGARNGVLKHLPANFPGRRDHYGSDEVFLSSFLWNQKYIQKCFIHDDYYENLGIEKKITRPRKHYEFLGDCFDAQDNRFEYYWRIIKNKTRQSFNLFTTFYIPNNEERLQELIKCYKENKSSGLFNRIYVISEEDVSAYIEETDLIQVSERPTFSDIFDIVNKETVHNDINIVANSDILFDKTIKLAKDIDDNQVYCLSRWDGEKHCGADSQDTWVFKGSIKCNGDFHFGVIGCDNAIAGKFAESNYTLLNPCLSIKTYHIHSSNYRTYDSFRINGRYEFIQPTTLKTCRNQFNNLLSETFLEKKQMDLVFKELKQYDLVYNFIAGESGKTDIPNTKPIYFCTSDESHKLEPKHILDKCSLIFKNYAPYHQHPKIIPFPLPSNIKQPKFKDISKRKYDYCLMGQQSELRYKIKSLLESTPYKGKIVLYDGFNNGNKTDYIKTLQNSKVCICPPGMSSPETFRYTEAASAGCIIVCSRMPPFWYYKNPYEFQIPDWNLLPQLLDRLFQITENELDAVGVTTLQYYENFLSPKALAFHCNNFIRNSI